MARPARSATRRRAFGATLAIGILATGAAQAAEPAWLTLPEDAAPEPWTRNDRGTYALPIGRFTPTEAPTLPLEGRVSRRIYTVAAGASDPDAEARRLVDSLLSQGFSVIFQCSADACGGFYFRFGADIAPPPAMRIDVRAFTQTSLVQDGTGTHVSVLVSQVLDRIHVQTTVVEADGGGASALPAPTASTARDPMAPGPFKRPPETPDLRAVLYENGRAVIPGLAFQTGGSQLADTSSAALDAVADMLEALPEVRVLLVGHSDNEGSLEANTRLSRDRAASVLEALARRGIARDRMEAHGIAYLAPLTSNATQEGRLLNRRVEIVLR